MFSEKGRRRPRRVDVGRPILESSLIPTLLPGDPPVRAPLEVGGRTLNVTCVSMGNPELLAFLLTIWMTRSCWESAPRSSGIRRFPRRVNAGIGGRSSRRANRDARLGSRAIVACGTGASDLVAGALNNLTERTIIAHLPGGDLTLDWADSGEVYMTGPAAEVFTGEWSAEESES